VDPSVETGKKRDSCGWLLRALQQRAMIDLVAVRGFRGYRNMLPTQATRSPPFGAEGVVPTHRLTPSRLSLEIPGEDHTLP
jgi:hypothetical protein